jgi:hypothetical protein
MLRTVILTTILALATNAEAQITTYVAPPRPISTAEAVAAADSARRDSVAEATMVNMKTWVDSASGIAVPEYVGRVDSTALVNDPGRVAVERPVATTFSDGSVAPATASDLPTLAIIGIVALALGGLLLERHSRG